MDPIFQRYIDVGMLMPENIVKTISFSFYYYRFFHFYSSTYEAMRFVHAFSYKHLNSGTLIR